MLRDLVFSLGGRGGKRDSCKREGNYMVGLVAKSALMCVALVGLVSVKGARITYESLARVRPFVHNAFVGHSSHGHDWQLWPKPTPFGYLKSADEGSVLSLEDMTVFESVSRYATEHGLERKTMGDSIQLLAEFFLGLPYQGHQLDQNDREVLSVNLQTFDCVIFVETMLALARNFAVHDYSVPNFLENMQAQRYRNGDIDGYCSRLHYFSDWIRENEHQGRVSNITADLGGIAVQKQLDFMTSHREAYPQLVDNDENFRCIAEMEAALSPVELTYIPTAEISGIYSELQAGDIVAIATSVPGLDVSHT
ncbi:MAG: N-acetylmuramoyl-L-alanine amidase-like domain-containing protein, partial [Cyanobacteria bacterium P01_E01_bin.34]